MYSLQSKIFFVIIILVLGLFIFQTSRVSEKQQIIENQNELIELRNTDGYTNSHIRNINEQRADVEKPFLRTQEEIYLHSKVKTLEAELNSLRNQIKAIQNENNNLKSQITTLKEQRNLRFKELHETFKPEDNKNTSISKPSSMTTGYKESFEVISETLPI